MTTILKFGALRLDYNLWILQRMPPRKTSKNRKMKRRTQRVRGGGPLPPSGYVLNPDIDKCYSNCDTSTGRPEQADCRKRCDAKHGKRLTSWW